MSPANSSEARHILMDDAGIRQWMGNGFKTKNEVKEDEKAEFQTYNESRRARGMTMLDPPEEKEGKADGAKA